MYISGHLACIGNSKSGKAMEGGGRESKEHDYLHEHLVLTNCL